MSQRAKIFSPALCTALHDAATAADAAAAGVCPRPAAGFPPGGARLQLLAAIADTGSISAAARALGISYRGAWNSVEAMNNLSPRPLVERLAGGPQGGGTRLTEHGAEMLRAGSELEARLRDLLATVDGGDFTAFFEQLRRWNMKTSARNQLLGTVAEVQRGAVNAEVRLALDGGAMLTAIVTNSAVDELELAVGRPAVALVKASSVILIAEDGVRTSARNRLRGTVSRIVSGPVNAEVVIDVGGKALAAVVTLDSVAALGLLPGSAVTALVKASSVILATSA